MLDQPDKTLRNGWLGRQGEGAGYCLQVIAFIKAFAIFSRKILTEKLMEHGLDEHPWRY